MRKLFLLIFSLAVVGCLQGQSVSSIYPQKGAAYFTVTIEGDQLNAIDQVIFKGGKSICFYPDPSGKSLQALAPSQVKTGPVTMLHRGDSLQTDTFTVVEGAHPAADFQDRDTLPQTDLPRDQWCNTDSWGPERASSYPPPPEPPKEVDRKLWLQARVIAAALKWRYLPYQHHHIPAFDATECLDFPVEDQVGPGLDCSNYTSWIYLYAFNHHMSSGIRIQAEEDQTGRLLNYGEALEPGDLLFSKGSPNGASVTHVSVYINPGHRIDETGAYCDIRPWDPSKWPANSFHSARRPLDNIVDTSQIINNSSSDRIISKENSVVVFPNPSSEKIHIRGLEKGDKIKLLTLQGKGIKTFSHFSESESFSLDVSDITPGYYLLSVYRNYEIITIPFVKMD